MPSPSTASSGWRRLARTHAAHLGVRTGECPVWSRTCQLLRDVAGAGEEEEEEGTRRCWSGERMLLLEATSESLPRGEADLTQHFGEERVQAIKARIRQETKLQGGAFVALGLPGDPSGAGLSGPETRTCRNCKKQGHLRKACKKKGGGAYVPPASKTTGGGGGGISERVGVEVTEAEDSSEISFI